MFQTSPDAAIHVTLGGGIAAVLGKILWDEIRKSRMPNGNGNGSLRVLEDQGREQIRLLQEISKGITVVLDRTK